MIERQHVTTALIAFVVTAALATGAAATVPSSASADTPTADAESIGNTPSLLQQQNATIQLGSSAVKSGENATITLSTNAENVAGYQANITFDQSVVKVQSVSGTDDFETPTVNVNNEKGKLFITQARPDGGDSPALAHITFYAVSDTGERSKLAFVEDDTYVNSAEAENVDVTTSPGSVQVTNGEFVALNDETTSAPNGEASGAGVLSGVSLEMLGGVALVAGAVGLGVFVGRRS